MRECYEIGDADDCSDQLSAATDENGSVTITIEEWTGDTETGFGRESSIQLSVKQAVELGEWLISRSHSSLKG